jgi:SAM-dependent methyltransferase
LRQTLKVTVNRWMSGDGSRGAHYDRRFDELAASGANVHGEAALVDSYGPDSVLDAGCGTGRVAIELARRGRRVVGVDLDPRMLEVARRKAPHLTWIEGDLADPALTLHGPFDAVVMAGNVMIFVSPGSEGTVLSNLSATLVPGGHLIAGYSLRPGGLSTGVYDGLAAPAGLLLEDRWSTWDRLPFDRESSTYAVSVHRRSLQPAIG